MLLRQIFDDKLAQYAYIIGCQATGEAIVIDPERDIDRYTEIAEKENLKIVAVVDTHIHADYISGTREFAELGAKVYASDEGDADWKFEWLPGSKYDYELLKDGNTFRVGNIEFKVVHTPGHTPEHISFLVTDLGGGADVPMGIITGDFVFVGDLGRPDLLESAAGMVGVMEPSARTLYKSVQQFLGLEDYLQIWPAHGAGSACGKALGAVPESTVGYERRFNASIEAAKRGEDAFVSFILEGQPEPPMYFARMKRDNRIGPRVLGSLPQPPEVTATELGALANRIDVVVIDLRLDRSGFMAGHLPGSLFAPLNRAFNTVVGSFVEEDTPMYLIVEAHRVEEAVRDLIRIGLDNVAGYATPETLVHYQEQGGELATIEEISFDKVGGMQKDGAIPFDVRGEVEFTEAHIPGARNIAYTRLWVRRDEVPSDHKLLVYCQTGARSAVSSALLSRLGYNVTYVNDEFEQHGIASQEHAEGGVSFQPRTKNISVQKQKQKQMPGKGTKTLRTESGTAEPVLRQ